MYMLGACGGQMRAVDLLDLEIHMIVGHDVGAGN